MVTHYVLTRSYSRLLKSINAACHVQLNTWSLNAFSFVTYELTLVLLRVKQLGSLRLDFGAYEYIKDDVFGLVKCVKYTAQLTMVLSHCVDVVKAVWYFLRDVRLKCVDINLYVRFGRFNKAITGVSDNANRFKTWCYTVCFAGSNWLYCLVYDEGFVSCVYSLCDVALWFDCSRYFRVLY